MTMFLEVVAIEQRRSMKTKTTQNYLRLRMPNAQEIVVEVPEDDVVRVLEAEEDEAVTRTETSSTAEVVHLVPAQAAADELLHWIELDDDTLPPVVKSEFFRLGLPEMMTVADITSHAHSILASLAEIPEESEESPPPGRVVPIRQEQSPYTDDDTGVPSI